VQDLFKIIRCSSCGRKLESWWHCLDCICNLCDACKKRPRRLPRQHKATHQAVPFSRPTKLSLREVRDELLSSLEAFEKKLYRQKGVPTFFDNHFKYLVRNAVTDNGTLNRKFFEDHRSKSPATQLRELLYLRKMGRFVDYFTRRALSGRAISDSAIIMSQGTWDCLEWRGRLLFKSAFDIAIYQTLLDELMPETIVELGSGDGGSAIWLRDTIKNPNTKVYSLDIVPPQIEYPNVEFMKADCRDLGAVLKGDMLALWPHPWLVILDVHVNVEGMLTYFDSHLQKGDYIVVEDSASKEKETNIARFLLNRRTQYLVDTRLTDLLGHNVTCSPDTIFKRVL